MIAESLQRPGWSEHQTCQDHLLLADISGYTALMASVEQAHGRDQMPNEIGDEIRAGVGRRRRPLASDRLPPRLAGHLRPSAALAA